MWVMVVILISNLSSSDMVHLDNISSGMSQRFDSEEACHNQMRRSLLSFDKERGEAFISKNKSNRLTLTLKGKNVLVYTCIPTI
jgi:hypothetical protein